MKNFNLAPWAAAAAGCVASTIALADNPLGAYVGLGVGESTVRSDNNYYYGGNNGFYGYYGDGAFDYSHHFAWNAEAGIRPIPFAGAELEYLDFGHPGSDTTYYYNNFNYGPDSHPRALAAFGVGYLPIPLPFLDVYGKAGVARLHTNVNGFDGGACGATGNNFCSGALPAEQSEWDTRFAWGVGIQTRFRSLGVRAEYQRISSQYGDPDMFNVGVNWTF
jgi:hypothetical protein